VIRVSWWRGVLVVLSWIVWPLFAFLVDLVVHLWTSNSRGCSIEGCNFAPNLLELAIYFMPPLVGTIAWWRWRLGRRTHAAL